MSLGHAKPEGKREREEKEGPRPNSKKLTRRQEQQALGKE
jgi:hypothetical protein